MKKVFIIGDTHFPFVKDSTLRQIYDAVKRERPEVIVQIGDLFDMYSFSKFPRSHNWKTPKQELEESSSQAANFWQALQKQAPKASCYQLLGNHDSRPFKRVIERFPDLDGIVSFKELYTFPLVQTIHDARAELVIDKIVYIHGYFTQLGKHCLYNMKPVVCGHSHVGGSVFYNINDELIWELNVGYIADPSQIGLSYTPQKMVRWTQGYGIIDEQGPRFCPLR